MKKKTKPNSLSSLSGSVPRKSWTSASTVKAHASALHDTSFHDATSLHYFHEDSFPFYVTLSVIVSFGNDPYDHSLGRLFIYQELLDGTLSLMSTACPELADLCDDPQHGSQTYIAKLVYRLLHVLQDAGHIKEDIECESETPVQVFRITERGIGAFGKLHGLYGAVAGEVEERLRRLTGE